MDRQPLTDRLGDKLLAEYGGAAAAYSLRALNGNGDNVVRVRRASDNHEKDFTALQVSSGEMTNWVNSQIVPPLDIGVETADGRPSVPEGGTSIGTPAAAYSLRNLSTTYTGNVVEVRRSSDNAERDFTASELADGTLEDWVGEEQVGWNFQPTWDVSTGDAVISSQSSTATTSTVSFTTTSGSSFIRQSSKPNHILASAGDQVVANITTTGLSGTPRIRLRTSGTNTDVANIPLQSGTNDHIFNVTGSCGYFVFTNLQATGGGTITINSVKVIGKSGFVATWYDQSGSDNHATQTDNAKQPKIVDAGTYLEEIDFDGTDDQLSASDPVITASSSGTYSGFSVQTVATNEKGYLYGCASPDNGTSAYAQITEGVGVLSYALSNTNSVQFDTISRASGENLLSFCYNNGDAGMLVNGGGIMTDAGTYDFAAGTSDFIIGNRNQGPSEGTYLDGTIKEIIIYNSDQSANRTAIEANIGEHYGISGIPAYDNTVDGYVETWYDQSGNGNNATQTVTANQPKIVDGGTYLGELDFDGVDDRLFRSHILNTDDVLYTALVAKNKDLSKRGIYVSNLFYNTSTDNGGFAIESKTFSQDGKIAGWLDDTNVAASVQSGLSSLTQNQMHLLSFDLSNGSSKFHLDGSLVNTFSTNMNSENGGGALNIGNNLGGTGPLLGSIKEIIIYNSDQSANRPAIEANINNQYSIY